MLRKIGNFFGAVIILVFALLCTSFVSTESNDNIISAGASMIMDINSDYPVKIDGNKIEKPPERVISLSPSLTEITYDLGYKNQLIGVSAYCDYNDYINQLERYGGEHNPWIKEILNSGADYVISSKRLPKSCINKLNSAGIKSIVFSPAENLISLEKLYENLGSFFEGKINGKLHGEEVAGRLLAEFDKIYTELGLSNEEAKTKICFVTTANGNVATGDTLLGQLLESAGGENIAKRASNEYMRFSSIRNANPQIIFCSKGVAEGIVKLPAFIDSDAVRYDKIIEIDSKLFERQSSRLLECVTLMSEALSS